MSGFGDAVPTLASFSMLLKCESYTEWSKLSDHLQVSKQTVENMLIKLHGHRDKDKRAFLMILASWREKAPKRKKEKTKDRIANYKNLRQAVESAGFSDLVEAVDEMKERCSEKHPVDYTYDMCKCGKPKALRIKETKSEPYLFVICPHKIRKKQCKGSFVRAEKLLDSHNLYRELPDPARELIQFLQIKRNAVLVNFEHLGPHLISHDLLDFEEHRNIIESTGVSEHFGMFVNKYLSKGDRGDVVDKFIKVLRDETKYIRHQNLLKKIESNKKIMQKNSRGKNQKMDCLVMQMLINTCLKENLSKEIREGTSRPGVNDEPSVSSTILNNKLNRKRKSNPEPYDSKRVKLSDHLLM